jgi:hypothetical protein
MLLITATVTPVSSSALAMSSATRKKGTARPSLSPLSTSSACRTRTGTAGSETTFWPRAASVEASIVDRRTTDASAMPGNTSAPTPAPTSIVSGSPIRRRRLGHPSWRRSERRSIRAASVNRSRTSATSATRSATTDSTEMSSNPSTAVPTNTPDAVKYSAEVIPRRSSGPEKALHTSMTVSSVITATIGSCPDSLITRPPHVDLLRDPESDVAHARVYHLPASGRRAVSQTIAVGTEEGPALDDLPRHSEGLGRIDACLTASPDRVLRGAAASTVVTP